MKIYGYTAAGALANFLKDNTENAEPAYLLEQAFRFWKSEHAGDTTITGEGNFNVEFNYKSLEL